MISTAKIKQLLNNRDRNYVLIGQIIGALLALVSGKLIAIYILPADFGTYNIQWAAYTFLSSMFVIPFLQYLKASNNTILPKIGTYYFTLTSSILVLFTYGLFLIFLFSYYGSVGSSSLGIFLLLFIFSALHTIIGDYFKTSDRLIAFTNLGVFGGVCSVMFLIVFLVLGLEILNHVDILWAMQLISVIVVVAFFNKYRIYKTKVQIAYKTFVKKYLRFAGPLMFLAIWMWINNYFDRFAIEYFLSMREVGIYNASYSVGSKFFLLISPVFLTLLTPSVFAFSKKNIKKDVIRKYALYYFILAIPVLIMVYYLKDIIGALLLSSNYEDGFHLIFWIALAFFIITEAELYQLLFYSEQKTKFILYGNILAAIINIALNILLIPMYGITGAAIATCISFSIHLIFILFYFERAV